MSVESSKRVLMFEDDYVLMRDLKEHIEEALHLSVELSADTSVGSKLSQEHFDLVIIDIMIQPVTMNASKQLVQNVRYENVSWKTTGIEFFRRLRIGEFSGSESGTPSNVPVMILSALANSSLAGEISNIGAVQTYLEKPFTMDEVIAAISAIIKNHK